MNICLILAYFSTIATGNKLRCAVMPGSEKNKKTLLIVQKAQKRIITLRIFLIRLKYAIYTCPQPILAK